MVGKAYASLLTSVIASDDTSEYIKVRFKGTSFGIVDVIGPSSGQIRVYIDNDPPRYINRFDEYATYYRMNYTIINGLKEGNHEVTIKVSPEKLDKALILQKRNNKINYPKLYENQFLYLGGILVK